MKMPCGGCGRFTPGSTYTPSMGCFYCWSSQHSEKYKGYWDETGKVALDAGKTVTKPVSYEPQYNPYLQPIESRTIHFPPTEKPPEPVAEPARPANCVHLGGETGQIACQPCGGVRIKTFACEVYGTCTIAKKLESTACCDGGRCPSFSLVAKLPDGNS